MKVCLVNVENKKYSFQISLIPYNLYAIKAATPEKYEVQVIHDVDDGDDLPDADVYGFGIYKGNILKSYALGDKLLKKNKIVVFGGPALYTLYEEASTHCSCLALGEVEKKWKHLLEDIENNNFKKIYKCDNSDLEKFPIINRTYDNKFHFYNLILTTKGCPFKCAFCNMHHFLGTEVRKRPIEDVLWELQDMKNKTRGIFKKLLYFVDANIAADKEYARYLFRGMIDLNLNFRWFSQCSIQIALDDELLDLAKKSGCVGLFIGYESLDQKNLEYVKKQNLNLDYYAITKKIKEKGITIFASFVMGLDFDTKESIVGAYKFCEELNIDYARFFPLVPMKDTKIYELLEKENRVEKYKFKPKNMEYKELIYCILDIHGRFYSYKKIFKRAKYNLPKGNIGAYLFYLFIAIVTKYYYRKLIKLKLNL